MVMFVQNVMQQSAITAKVKFKLSNESEKIKNFIKWIKNITDIINKNLKALRIKTKEFIKNALLRIIKKINNRKRKKIINQIIRKIWSW